LTAPRHPYTQALLSVLPESPERIMLSGEPPEADSQPMPLYKSE
jgi:peptide/nickel transport system ATP-binding protein